jgi:hypothetical protein
LIGPLAPVNARNGETVRKREMLVAGEFRLGEELLDLVP